MASDQYGPGYGAPQGTYQAPATPGFPIRLTAAYPEKLSRGLIFVKWLLVIPHFIVLYVLEIALLFVTLVAWFAILFTGKYPRGMYEYAVGVLRWYVRVSSYVLLLHDQYPPFSLQDQ